MKYQIIYADSKIKCPLCDKSFEPMENQIILMAWGKPNITYGEPAFVCRECYEMWSDGV